MDRTLRLACCHLHTGAILQAYVYSPLCLYGLPSFLVVVSALALAALALIGFEERAPGSHQHHTTGAAYRVSIVADCSAAMMAEPKAEVVVRQAVDLPVPVPVLFGSSTARPMYLRLHLNSYIIPTLHTPWSPLDDTLGLSPEHGHLARTQTFLPMAGELALGSHSSLFFQG